MKKVLVIATSTKSAGTRGLTQELASDLCINKHNITLVTSDEVTDLDDKSIVKVKFRFGWLSRLIVEYYVVYRLCKRNNYDVIIGLANFMILPFLSGEKIILVRHPKLLESHLGSRRSIGEWSRDKFRDVVFWLSVKMVDRVVLQTNRMESLFYEHGFNVPTKVVPNPVKKVFMDDMSFVPLSGFSLIYPSRYYSHKNHEIIFELDRIYSTKLNDLGITIYLTLKPEYWRQLQGRESSTSLVNLGEIAPIDLNSYYNSVNALLFTSLSETYGNALNEAQFKELPILASKMPYINEFVGEHTFTFDPFDVHDLMRKLVALKEMESFKVGKTSDRKVVGGINWINMISE